MRDIIILMANKNIGSLCLFLKNKKNIEYLNYIESNIPIEVLDRNISEKIYYFVNDIKYPLLCKCGNHLSFIGFKNGYRKSCGNKKCYTINKKQTCIDRYGVDNPKKSKDILLKEKENIKNKWGLDHYMLDNKVRNKFKKTMIDKYGVEWAQQSNEISEKSKETWKNNPEKQNIIDNRRNILINKSYEEKQEINNKKIETILNKWGKHYMLDNDIKNKINDKFILKYGVDSPFKDKNVAEKRIKSYKQRTSNIISGILPNEYSYISHCYNKNKTGIDIELFHEKCEESFTIHYSYFKTRIDSNKELCLHCNPILSGKSNKEVELLSFIKENYEGTILTNVKSIIKGELDIYLPELNIAFEFNGLYWHSELYKDSLYHLNKTNDCINNGIELFHVFEDDWENKTDILKSMILNKIGRSNKIWARKCEIRIIEDNNIIRNFLNFNHIQGFVGSKVKIGLFYENELVSLMTFGNLRKSLGQNSKEGSWELLRFCNKLNYSVIGGASRLFKYFITNFSISDIVSYSDNSRGIGNMYKNLNFEFKYKTKPNYYYVIDGVRKHRFNYRKDILVKRGEDATKTEIQIMNNLGYYRIFDCGSTRWEFKSNV